MCFTSVGEILYQLPGPYPSGQTLTSASVAMPRKAESGRSGPTGQPTTPSFQLVTSGLRAPAYDTSAPMRISEYLSPDAQIRTHMPVYLPVLVGQAVGPGWPLLSRKATGCVARVAYPVF